MTESPEGSPYLEIDAIPDPVRPQVFLACATVLLALFALAGPPLGLWPLVVLVLVLWPREVLSAPERALRGGFLPEADHPELAARVRELATELGLSPLPRLAVLPGSEQGPFVVGSWRRSYLCVGEAFARQAAGAQTEPARLADEAILLHELAHLRHRDPVKVELARALMRVAARVTAWMVLFAIGWWGFMGLCLEFALAHRPSELGAALDTRFGLPFPFAAALLADDGWWDAARGVVDHGLLDRVARATLGNLLPLGVLTAFPLAGATRRMLRLREFMADAAAYKVYRRRAADAADPRVSNAAQGAMSSRMGRRGPFHPSSEARVGCLRQPERVLGSLPTAAVHLGFFLLLLHVVTESSVAAVVFDSLPIQLPLVAGGLLLGTDLIARAAVEPLPLRRLAGAVGLLLLPTAAGIVLNLLFVWGIFVADPDGARALWEGALGMLHLGGVSLDGDVPALLAEVALARAGHLVVAAGVLLGFAVAARTFALRELRGAAAGWARRAGRTHTLVVGAVASPFFFGTAPGLIAALLVATVFMVTTARGPTARCARCGAETGAYRPGSACSGCDAHPAGLWSVA